MTLLTCILSAVHYILALRIIVFNWILEASRLWQLSYWKSGCCGAEIQSAAKSLQKLPVHVGLVIVEENISYTDIANMLVWCMASGISYISIYDRAGICKNGREVLKSSLEKQKSKVLGSTSPQYESRLHTSRVLRASLQECLPHRVDIMLLSMDDGRNHLVSTTRRLAGLVQRGEYKASDIHPSNIDSMLLDEHGFPDPDLVLRFGPTDSLLGFLPWQMRLTEILSFPSHQNIDYKSFNQLLLTYGGTEQRFGK